MLLERSGKTVHRLIGKLTSSSVGRTKEASHIPNMSDSFFSYLSYVSNVFKELKTTKKQHHEHRQHHNNCSFDLIYYIDEGEHTNIHIISINKYKECVSYLKV